MRMLHGGPKGRTLHLVDLENLLGDDRCTEAGRAGLDEYLRLARWDPGDHVVVAAHPKLIEQVAFEPPVPGSYHAACGPDSADRMLLSLAPAGQVADRFDRLVIGSGDGIFVSRARQVRDAGTPVLIVARPDGTADRFRRWAFPVVPFDLDEPVPALAVDAA